MFETNRFPVVDWGVQPDPKPGLLEIHPDDAQTRGIVDADWVGVSSRAGQTVLRAIRMAATLAGDGQTATATLASSAQHQSGANGMNIGQRVKMANRRGTFFAVMPDQQYAMNGIAEHIRKFWAPWMRGELRAFLQANAEGSQGDIALDPLVLKAMLSHRDALTPAA